MAQRLGLKTGDRFEVVTDDGRVFQRRYDDTVPSMYKGKPLPETVDLYNRSGSNKFGGVVKEIRPLANKPKPGDNDYKDDSEFPELPPIPRY